MANDTQPNKLYRNLRNGKFKDVAVEAGLAFSADGKARAGMGVDVGDFENSGKPGIAITNFDNEMIGLYRATRTGVYDDIATASGVGLASRNTLGFGCAFLDADLDGLLDLGGGQRTHRRNGAQHSRQHRLRAAAAAFFESSLESRRHTIPRRGRAKSAADSISRRSAAGWLTAISIAMAIWIFC